jgi:hypothetical protein
MSRLTSARRTAHDSAANETKGEQLITLEAERQQSQTAVSPPRRLRRYDALGVFAMRSARSATATPGSGSGAPPSDLGAGRGTPPGGSARRHEGSPHLPRSRWSGHLVRLAPIGSTAPGYSDRAPAPVPGRGAGHMTAGSRTPQPRPGAISRSGSAAADRLGSRVPSRLVTGNPAAWVHRRHRLPPGRPVYHGVRVTEASCVARAAVTPTSHPVTAIKSCPAGYPVQHDTPTQ